MPFRTLTKPVKSITSSSKRLTLLTIVLIVLLLASTSALVANRLTSSLPQEPNHASQEIALIRQQGQLIVGIVADRPPFTLEKSGQLSGYEIDLAKALAVEIGTPITFKKIKPSQAVSPGDSGATNILDQGQVNLLIAGLSPTAYRQEMLNLSQPYVSVSQVAITLKNAPNIDSASDIKDKVVAVVKDSINHEFAKTITASSKVKTSTDTDQLTSLLTNAQTDLALIDLYTANQLVAANEQLRVASPALVEESYVIATAKSQWQLADIVNSAITSLHRKGVLQSLQQKWLHQL